MIALPEEKISAFCEQWHVQEFALFGSVFREDFSATSDIDVLITFKDGAHYNFADLETMQHQLEQIFGRKVDLGLRKAVEADPNYLRRKSILNSAQVIYAA